MTIEQSTPPSQNPHVVQFAPSTKTFEEVIEECIRDPPVMIGPSKRHGNGVFATRDIPRGDPVCYYDGVDILDSKGISVEDHIYSVNWISSWLPDGSGSKTRIGYRVPKTKHGIAQFINDSCFPDLDQHVNPETSTIEMKKAYDCMQMYQRKSRAAAMVCVDARAGAAPMWYFALRDIRKGEEIVNTYGDHYWTIQLLRISRCLSVHLVLSLMHESEFYQSLLHGKQKDDIETDVILARYDLRAAVDFGWQHGRWTEGDVHGKPLTRRQFLHELVRTYIVSSESIE